MEESLVLLICLLKLTGFFIFHRYQLKKNEKIRSEETKFANLSTKFYCAVTLFYDI